ncbi:signal recognition particle-docking protein FtsY [Planctomicrobium sp. SH668]|uniref:signal recognition particle-docking protein FtsY n=1 Tax=Planctomicrobium sp. SH668 TaxID=3448126 RepID=UPI003F5C0603
MGFFDSLKSALKKTKDVLRTDVRDLLKSGEILDEAKLEEFYRGLITTDMGVAAATEVVDDLRKEFGGRTVVPEKIWEVVRARLKKILIGENATGWDPSQPISPLNMAASGPTIILVSGVNGVGKTTSIAKLAKVLHSTNRKVLLAAGDTFRAAAVDQLTMWSQRIGCEIVTKPPGSDPASVAFEGCAQAVQKKVDFAIIDTAGRLQTQQNLMNELQKIHRVIAKQVEGAPHESLLVLDATTGQNGISQAAKFSEAAGCTGIILTKLDGTAKGGVVVAIRQKMGIPVKYIGVGEKVEDLQVFSAEDFVNALFNDV